jgi:hypothetical protein
MFMGNIDFMVLVRTMTRGQSAYPDIALYYSNYCVYWIEAYTKHNHWEVVVNNVSYWYGSGHYTLQNEKQKIPHFWNNSKIQ